MKRKIITALLTVSTILSGLTFSANAKTDFNESVMNRGLAAMKTSGGIYLSWRLNPEEDNIVGSSKENVAFDIYRDGEIIARESSTTNYTDKNGSVSSVYKVQPVIVSGTDEKKGKMSEEASAFKSGSNYFDIPLTLPEPYTITYKDDNGNDISEGPLSFMPNDCSAGDLDGDGEYEIVVKYVCRELDVGNGGWSGITKLAAYKLDGTKMWEKDIDFGRNVYSSAHTVQFLVYDFDNDGKAEITAQTSLGSLDAKGNYVSKVSNDSKISSYTDDDNKNADFRSAANDGRVTDGDEFLTIFKGETGEAIDTIKYPTDRYNITCWGKDDGGNRSLRFLADVAYLDGEKPYAVYWRGYYNHDNGRTGVAGISFDGKRLSVDYIFDTLKGQPGYTSGNEKYAGEGNHNITVADVDNDGKDEIISGAMCMEIDENNQLMPRWCTFKGHGDALHIGDYDPTHEGYEFYTVHEEGNLTNQGVTLDFGSSVIDANTGEILFHQSGNNDTGRGIMANVGAGGYYQIQSSSNPLMAAMGNNNFERVDASLSVNFRIFWDGDLYDELLDGTNITSWNGSGMERIFSAKDCSKINGSKSNPSLQADIFGDWREEVIYPLSDGSGLRVFTTNIPTKYKMKTLMSDNVYRSGVAAEQTAYNQPPHLGYYIDIETFMGKPESLKITSLPKTTYSVGEEFDSSGLTVTAEFKDGSYIDILNYDLIGFDSTKVGSQKITIDYNGVATSFNVNIVSGFTINNDGYITGYNDTKETEVTVPEMINNVTVKGFAENALLNSNVKRIYIHDTALEFANADIFPNDIAICGYSNSTAEKYAKEHNISWVALDADIIYNLNPDNDIYSGFTDGKIITQGKNNASFADTDFTYYASGAGDFSQWMPTDNYGFYVQNDGKSNYIKAVSGFCLPWSNIESTYIKTNNDTALKNVGMAKMEFNFCFPTDTVSPYINISDDKNVIDSISVSNNRLKNDVWYTYKLTYQNGKYKSTISDLDGNIISDNLLSIKSGSILSNTISFSQKFTNNMTAGVGNIYIDDISITVTPSSNVSFKVTDENGNPISYADILIGDEAYCTNSEGTADISVKKGYYSVKISAKGYNEEMVDINAYKDSSNNIVLNGKDNILVNTIENIYFSIDLSSKEYSGFKLTQGREFTEKTIDGVTYAANKRDAGGDGVSGFKIVTNNNELCLSAAAGKYNTSNRNAYMVFNNVPNNGNYTFKTDILFKKNTYDLMARISDGTNEITSFDVNISDKLARETWYTYTLSKKDGEYVETISDLDGNVLYSKKHKSSAAAIKRIDFTGAADKNAEIYMKNTAFVTPGKEEVEIKANDKYSVLIFKGEDSVKVTVKTDENTDKMVILAVSYGQGGEMKDISTSKFEKTDNVYTAIVNYNSSDSKIMLWNDMLPVMESIE